MQDIYRMLSDFKSKVKASGLMEELRRREYALSRSQRKHEKQKTARVRKATELRKKNHSARSRGARPEGYVGGAGSSTGPGKPSNGPLSDD